MYKNALLDIFEAYFIIRLASLGRAGRGKDLGHVRRVWRTQLQLTHHNGNGSTSMPHYHMRWSNSTLDWEAFSTSEEAEAHAKQLVRLGESYVQADGDCQRCSSLPHLSGRNLAARKEVSKNQEAAHINSSPST